MSARRLPLGLLAPIALVVLITALGFLQYRWVGQVSERERDQLRQSLDRRAREFAGDFDREIGRAYQVFTPESGFQPANPERFAKQHDEWQTVSPFAGLVKAAYFAQTNGEDFTLFRYDGTTRAFESVAWPDALAPVLARLKTAHTRATAQLPGDANFIAFAVTPVLPAIPAILIPESEIPGVAERQAEEARVAAFARAGTAPAGTQMFNMMMTVRTARNHVVLQLDAEFLASQMLPTLAARHFPETGAGSFRLSVVNTKADALFSRGLTEGQTLDVQSSDATATFFGLRTETIRTSFGMPLAIGGNAIPSVTWSTVRGLPVGEKPAPTIRVTPAPAGPAPREVRRQQTEANQYSMVIEKSAGSIAAADVRVATGWTLFLQHAAGSLDAAVEQARRRNLFLSFGILGVLAASAGLVMVNARRSEKLAAQQMDFVATVSHELRTPLAVIRSAAQNLSAGVVHDASQAKRYGDLIESEGRRLTDMVEQVLEYAGLSDARRRPAAKAADAAVIVHDVVATSASLAEGLDMTFDVKADSDVPLILADEEAMRRALHNLIGNAVKYGGDGRWVGVSVSRGRGADDGYVLISVADRGRGIPADDLAHIFEPFYRGRHALDQQIRGNGLGLSLVKRIVEAQGGRVTVQSAPAKGSTFTLHIPAARGAAAEAVTDVPSSGLTEADRDGHSA